MCLQKLAKTTDNLRRILRPLKMRFFKRISLSNWCFGINVNISNPKEIFLYEPNPKVNQIRFFYTNDFVEISKCIYWENKSMASTTNLRLSVYMSTERPNVYHIQVRRKICSSWEQLMNRNICSTTNIKCLIREIEFGEILLK